METYDFKNEIIDKNGNKINILDVYNFNKIKEWINSLCHISTLLSRSGRIERRLFFNTQYRIIDEVLK